MTPRFFDSGDPRSGGDAATSLLSPVLGDGGGKGGVDALEEAVAKEVRTILSRACLCF